MRTDHKILAAAAAAGVLLATGGLASTASTTVANSVAGYGTSTVSGGTATSVVHTLAANGQTITSTTLVFSTSMENRTVKAAFGAGSLESCTVGADPWTTVTCTWGTPPSTAGASAFNVSVS